MCIMEQHKRPAPIKMNSYDSSRIDRGEYRIITHTQDVFFPFLVFFFLLSFFLSFFLCLRSFCTTNIVVVNMHFNKRRICLFFARTSRTLLKPFVRIPVFLFFLLLVFLNSFAHTTIDIFTYNSRKSQQFEATQLSFKPQSFSFLFFSCLFFLPIFIQQ